MFDNALKSEDYLSLPKGKSPKTKSQKRKVHDISDSDSDDSSGSDDDDVDDDDDSSSDSDADEKPKKKKKKKEGKVTKSRDLSTLFEIVDNEVFLRFIYILYGYVLLSCV